MKIHYLCEVNRVYILRFFLNWLIFKIRGDFENVQIVENLAIFTSTANILQKHRNFDPFANKLYYLVIWQNVHAARGYMKKARKVYDVMKNTLVARVHLFKLFNKIFV